MTILLLLMEFWTFTHGYAKPYMVSTFGRVSLDGKILPLWKDTNGYSYTVLYKNGSRVNRSVHRLVAESFIPNPFGFSQVNHRNEVKSDNRVENLEWCSPKYNSNYGMGSKRNKHYYEQYSLDGTFIRNFTTSQLKEQGFDKGGVRLVAVGKGKTYKGFKWKRVKYKDLWQQ